MTRGCQEHNPVFLLGSFTTIMKPRQEASESGRQAEGKVLALSTADSCYLAIVNDHCAEMLAV